MNKTNLIINGILVVGLLALTWLHFSSNRVVYVDTNLLMQKYQGMKDARIEFEKKAKVWQSQSDTLLKEWQDQLKAYEKERSRLSEKQKKEQENILRTKQQQINSYRQSIDKKAREEEQKLTQTVLNQVNDYITEYGKKHNYKYILGANGTGGLLYADKKTDITNEILEGLNQEYKR